MSYLLLNDFDDLPKVAPLSLGSPESCRRTQGRNQFLDLLRRQAQMLAAMAIGCLQLLSLFGRKDPGLFGFALLHLRSLSTAMSMSRCAAAALLNWCKLSMGSPSAMAAIA